VLITKQQAIDHLRLPLEIGSPNSEVANAIDRDLTMKITQASALVLDYLKVSLTSPPDWDADAGTVPIVIQLATLCQLAELWRFRGDDPGSIEVNRAAGNPGDINQQAKDYLWRWRDPAIA
jgi:hypothetical protein